MEMKLPEYVEDELRKNAVENKINPDKMVKDYIKKLESPWIQNSEFIDDDDMHSFLMTRFIRNRKPIQ